MNIFEKILLKACPWRTPRRSAWFWVCPNPGDRAIGPFASYGEAVRRALNYYEDHPKILVELDWTHPWKRRWP